MPGTAAKDIFRVSNNAASGAVLRDTAQKQLGSHLEPKLTRCLFHTQRAKSRSTRFISMTRALVLLFPEFTSHFPFQPLSAVNVIPH